MLTIRAITIMTLLASPFALANQCEQVASQQELAKLKKNKFEIENEEKRNQLAVNLLKCLASTDPEIRDGVVYEANSKWLRGELLSAKTVQQQFDLLTHLLNQPNKDKNNFEQPFAALLLAEVVRVDRISPYLSDSDRQKAVATAVSFMNNIEDFRGFDDKHGWRHSVAHTADIMLQLALNKQTTAEQHLHMLNAITNKVVPVKNHFYIYGEERRLALPFLYLALQNKLTAEQIEKRIKSIAAPAPFKSWNDVYKSNKGLAKLHNTRGFLQSLSTLTAQSKQEILKTINQQSLKALKGL